MAEEDQTDIDRTEPQRKALEEMSQALLEKLNEMVAQQEARAQEFAGRVHSLSPLPQGLDEGVAAAAVEPVMPPPQVQAAKTTATHVPPLVRRAAQAVESLPPHRREAARAVRESAGRPQKKEEEGGMNVGLLVLIGSVLFILLRSCS